MSERLRIAGFLVLGLAHVACSTLTHYPEVTANARLAFSEGRFEEAIALFPAQPDGPDELLYRLERGLVLHTAGKYRESNAEWLVAYEALRGFEGRPSISMRSTLEGLGSLLLNDKVLPYDGEGFERVLLHAYLAMNFTFLGDANGAWVEARRAYEAQREEEQRYEKSYAGQGALARYLSGLVREGAGEIGEAYIDYKKVAELAPYCRAAQVDCLRIAKLRGDVEDEKRWKSLWPSIEIDPLWESVSAGECVLLFQCGLAPMKVPVELPIPHKDGIAKFSAPGYESRPNPVSGVRLLVDGQSYGRSEVLEDVETIARQNLADRMALIVAKATTRTAGKAYLTHRLQKRYGDWAALLGSLIAIVTEQADLRAWLTLPKNFQVLRVPLEAGAHHFSIELLGLDGNVIATRDLGSFRLRPAERLICNVRSVGLSSFSHVIGGEKLDSRKELP